jgi:hypothetical protein
VDTGSELERDYFRRDQRDGISPPDLSKDCTFAEHIVHARGKRTKFTSVSLDLSKIRDFGDTDYRLERQKLVSDRHRLIEHEFLISELRAARKPTGCVPFKLSDTPRSAGRVWWTGRSTFRGSLARTSSLGSSRVCSPISLESNDG